MRYLRIDQEACRDRERRALGGFGQAGDAERTADPHPASEDAGGDLGQAGELARSSGQHHARARVRRERRSGETVAHHLQNLLDPWADDAYQRRARDDVRRLALVLADRRHGDHVAIVRRAADGAAVQRLDPFGIDDLGGQAAGEIRRDVIAAERKRVGMHEPPVREHRDRGGARADVDDGGAEIGFVVGERAQPGRIGRGRHGFDADARIDRGHARNEGPPPHLQRVQWQAGSFPADYAPAG